MIRHHPEQDMLLEYAAGSLAWAPSLAVAAHLQLCARCRQQHEQLNTIGASLLEDSASERPSEGTFERLMSRIDSSNAEAEPTPVAKSAADHRLPADPMLANLPKVIRKLMADNLPLKWRRVSPALKMMRLKSGQDQYEVSFHRICRGGRTAEHDHRGQEVILVLNGSFSDADGVYSQGDFLVRQPGEVHRPIATEDQECLCLSIVEAPVSVTGVLGWFVNPFLSFRPG